MNKEHVQKGNQKVVTLFMDNHPNILHWKGLWHIFARHGDVIDAYIASKWNRGGRRFRFVRFEREVDALRATERLDGLFIYRNKISVAFAKYSGRMQHIRKSRVDVNEDLGQRKSTMKADIFRNNEKAHVEGGIGDPGKQRILKFKRVQGHVEVEDLCKMKRCLVGMTTTVCNVSSISSRLHAWGLGEIKVQRMGGKRFLLSFEDDELFTMLEDLQ
ncbi:hypothetical protein V6N13_029159 [Hibiscus sabdariffa]